MNRGDVTRRIRRQARLMPGVRQAARIVDDPGITSLQADDLAECITGAAGSNHFRGELPAFLDGSGAAAENKHPRRKLVRELAQVPWPLAVENLGAFLDFERVADFA